MKSIVSFFSILSALSIIGLKLMLMVIDKYPSFFIKKKVATFLLYCAFLSISVCLVTDIVVDLRKSIPPSLEHIAQCMPIAAYLLVYTPLFLISYRIYKLRNNK